MEQQNSNLPALQSQFGNNGGVLVNFDDSQDKQVADDEIDLRQLWRTILRYKKIIFYIFSFFLLSTLAISLLLRPMYTASALLEVNTDGRNLVKFQNVEQQESNSRDFMITQSNLLKSKSVAEDVVTSLDLINDSEFNGELRQRGLFSGVKSVLSLIFSGGNEVSEQELKDSAVARYQERLSVSAVRNSSLVKINFESFKPESAAKIANQHVKSYIGLSDKRRFNSTSGAKSFLEKEIGNVQSALETSEKKLTNFARQNGVIDVEDRNNIMMTRLSELNLSLAKVQNERIDAETKFQQSQSNLSSAVNPVEDNVIVLELKEQQAKLLAEYNEKSSIFKPAYPAMVQLQAKINDLEQSINSYVQKEQKKFKLGHEVRFKQLTKHQQRLEEAIENLKQKMLNLQDRAITYNILKREWEANKELYSGLLERTKEVGVAAGMELNVASIVDTAKTPKNASSPKIFLNMAIGGILGLLVGLGAAFLLAILDNTINDVDQLTQLSGVPHLGVLPFPDPEKDDEEDRGKKKKLNKKEKFNLDLNLIVNPTSQYSEAIQSLRTSLSFAKAGGLPKSIMITSAAPSEGKSTTTNNLAVSLAKSGKKVILLEADLRKSRLYKAFGIPSSPGLSDKLVNFDQGLTKYKVKEIPGLSIAVAGTRAPNPVELLGSENMSQLIGELEEEFDVVLIDCPPIIGLADSIMLSQLVDSVLFVVAAHTTSEDTVKNALRRLKSTNAPIIGTVFNKLKSDLSNESYDYYSYYGIDESAS